MSLAKDFRDFVARGNVIDLAVGVIIGGAFGKIVSSMVGDVLMPIIGLFMGKIDFSNLFIPLNGEHYENLAAATAAKAPVMLIGSFANNIINFLIVAFFVFLVVRAMSNLMPKSPAPAAMKDCPRCTSKIPVAATKCPHCTADVA